MRTDDREGEGGREGKREAAKHERVREEEGKKERMKKNQGFCFISSHSSHRDLTYEGGVSKGSPDVPQLGIRAAQVFGCVQLAIQICMGM